jgi:hypothetical protein
MPPWPQMKEQKAAEAVPKEHEEQETKGVKAEEQKPKVPSPMGWGLGRPSVRTLKALIPEPTNEEPTPQLHSLAPTPTPEPTRT